MSRNRNRNRNGRAPRQAAAGGGGGAGSTLLDLLTAAAGTAPTSLFVADEDAQAWDPQQAASPATAINNVGGYDDIDTSWVVDDGSVLRVGDLLQPDGSAEIIAITAISTNTLTVTRGYRGTSAIGVSDNTPLFLVTCPQAVDGERVFQIKNQIAPTRHCREQTANKGPVYRAGQIGTKDSVQFDDSASEYLQYQDQLSEMYAADQHTFVMLCQLDAPVLNFSDVYINDGIVGHSAGSSARPYCTHRNLASDTIYATAGTSGSPSGLSAALQSAPGVLASRHDATLGTDVVINKTATSRSGSGNTPLTNFMRLFRHTSYQGGKMAAFATFDVNLSDAQMWAVVDVLRAYAGLDAIADP